MFGLNSEAVEERLGLTTVNMGLNGYLGPRFLLNEVRDDMKAGDIIVLSFEYEAYFEPTPYNSVEGVGSDHLIMIKLRPSSIRYLEGWKQYRNVAAAVPRVAQAKVLRLADELKRLIKNRMSGGSDEEEDADSFLAKHIEIRAGFNTHGDLISHLGLVWQYPFWDDLNLAQRQLSEPLLDLIQTFCQEMRTRGVTVFIVPPPAPREWYEANQRYIEVLASRLVGIGKNGSSMVVGSPADFVWPQSYFFDNINHLTGEGRELRTEKVSNYLQSVLDGQPSAGE
jgi:hypothetical protein